MEGLSAKVFRTYNASITLDAELRKTEQMVSARQRAAEGDVVALMAYYNIANKNVAELCNHQRATPASHANAIAKMDEKIETLKAELKELKKAGSGKERASPSPPRPPRPTRPGGTPRRRPVRRSRPPSLRAAGGGDDQAHQQDGGGPAQ